MIELEHHTTAAWAPGVLADPVALLADHAYCELGAAASAQGLIHRHPDDHELGDRMAALACEELTHFRQVVRVLRGLGGELTERTANPYAEGLGRWARSTRSGGPSLLDHLLVAAVIEARSFERFCLLGEAAEDEAVRALFAELGPAERGHMLLFPELARRRFGERETERRLGEILGAEARILAGLDFAPRVHSGEPAVAAASL